MAHLERKMAPLYLTKQEKDAEQLDLYADVLGISRQQLLEAMISSCLKDLKAMDRMDYLISDVRIQDLFERFKKLSPYEKSPIDHVVNQD